MSVLTPAARAEIAEKMIGCSRRIVAATLAMGMIALLHHGCRPPVSDEVTIEVDLNAATITAGEPVWLRFRMLNRTGEAIGVGVHDDEPRDLDVRVSDSEGRRVDPPADYRIPMCGLWYLETVEPGEAFERGVLLSRRLRLDEPGEYVVRVRYPRRLPQPTDERPGRPVEFTLKLQVTPKDKDRLKAVAGDLAAAACRNSTEPQTARLAARALATIDDPIAVPFLKRLLDCGELLVRLEGVSGLKQEGSPRARRILIAAAEGRDPDLTALARGALESGDPRGAAAGQSRGP